MLIGVSSALHFGLHAVVELAPHGVEGRFPHLADEVALAVTLTLIPFTAMLAIARRTVEAHGGRISASTAAGGGMTFAIVLPRAAAEDAA